MSQLQAKLPTDTWVNATWDEYLQSLGNPAYEKARGYYYNGRMRLEMSALGNPHSRDRLIVIHAVCLFAGLNQIDFDGHDNCTYRKTGYQEAQPDVLFYVGANAEIVSWDATIIDLDTYPPPDLVIEVAYSSLADDKGEKRLLYESLEVREYWIIDVQNTQILAYAIADQGSKRIQVSQELPGLTIAILEEALRRSRETDQSEVGAWLLSQFQQ